MTPAAKAREAVPALDTVARETLRSWKRARDRVLEFDARRGDVHQWRIATRRLLAAEQLLAPASDIRQGPTPLERELGRAFRAAGRVRDAQVSIALARGFAAAHPVARAIGGALRRRLPRRRCKLQRRLEQVRVARLRRIVDGWNPAQARGKPAETASARLSRARRRIASALDSVPQRAAPGALHRLRLEVKQARYMADIVAMRLPAKPGHRVEPPLADWQRELGAIADLAAFDAHLERYARREPARATELRRLRRALLQRQRQLVATFLRRRLVA